MRMLLRGDAWIRDRLQIVYDWLLDRFGIYLGTVRGVCCALTWVFVGLGFFVNGLVSGHPVAGFMSITGYLLVMILGVWRSNLKEHLVADWEDQDKGRYERINARSEMRRGWMGITIRGIVFMAIGVGQGYVNSDEPVKLPWIALATVTALLWTWALELKVRARRESSMVPQAEFAR